MFALLSALKHALERAVRRFLHCRRRALDGEEENACRRRWGRTSMT